MRLPTITFKALLPAIVLLIALGLTACGDGGSDTTTTSEAPQTTGTEQGEPEPSGSEPEQGQGGNAPAPSGDAVRSEKVEIAEFTYQPDPVTIEEGGKVIWINRDSAPHTATADDGSFDTGTLEE